MLEMNLLETSAVKIEVYDMLGRKTEGIFSGELPEGNHQMAFGEALASGMYFVRFEVSGAHIVIRLVKN